MKKILFLHNGSGNHGCEAIIRTTAELLQAPKDVVLWSGSRDEDIYYGACNFEKTVVSEQISRFSKAYFESLLKRKVLKKENANFQIFIRDQFKGNAAISVGGDNYCYPWSAKQAVEWDAEIRKSARLSVLWGCSVDTASLTREVRQDIAGFDLITARENLTYELLKDINENTVKVADPAFLLKREDLPLPEHFIEGNTVGINISPMIFDYTDRGDLILENYKKLIDYILKETDMNICFVPHVVWPHNNDLEIIKQMYASYIDSGRVSYIEDGNCMQLKGFIARCRFFVGARTHATIAAYSSFVPTLTVGYSVKSKGIALDLFGTDEGYVIPVDQLQDSTVLAKQFQWLIDTESIQRKQLMSVIPDYQKDAAKAADYLKEVIDKRE